MKKLTLLAILCIPFVLFAEDLEEAPGNLKVANYDWINIDHQGLVMETRGDSILFEEQWMIPSPTGLEISTATEGESETAISTAEAPYWAEATYYRKGEHVYMLKLRFLIQCNYDEDGYIIVPEDEIE